MGLDILVLNMDRKTVPELRNINVLMGVVVDRISVLITILKQYGDICGRGNGQIVLNVCSIVMKFKRLITNSGESICFLKGSRKVDLPHSRPASIKGLAQFPMARKSAESAFHNRSPENSSSSPHNTPDPLSHLTLTLDISDSVLFVPRRHGRRHSRTAPYTRARGGCPQSRRG